MHLSFVIFFNLICIRLSNLASVIPSQYPNFIFYLPIFALWPISRDGLTYNSRLSCILLHSVIEYYFLVPLYSHVRAIIDTSFLRIIIKKGKYRSIGLPSLSFLHLTTLSSPLIFPLIPKVLFISCLPSPFPFFLPLS